MSEGCTLQVESSGQILVSHRIGCNVEYFASDQGTAIARLRSKPMAARPVLNNKRVAGSGVLTGPGVDTFTKLEKVETEGLAESRLMASKFPVGDLTEGGNCRWGRQWRRKTGRACRQRRHSWSGSRGRTGKRRPKSSAKTLVKELSVRETAEEMSPLAPPNVFEKSTAPTVPPPSANVFRSPCYWRRRCRCRR